MANKTKKPSLGAQLKDLKKVIEELNLDLAKKREYISSLDHANSVLLKALYPFQFKNTPNAFLGYDGNMTSALLCDVDVQRVRRIFLTIQAVPDKEI